MTEKKFKPTTPPENVASRPASEESDPIFEIGTAGVEGEPSLEEWHALREALFDELQGFPIPQNLVDAVRNFGHLSSVTWRYRVGDPLSDITSLTPVVGEKPQLKVNLDKLETPYGNTAGDALAAYLESQLTQAKGESAPARNRKTLAPSVVASIALDILEFYALQDQPPGEALVALLRALLKVDRRRLKSNREFDARYKAAWIVAQKPSIGTRELADMVDVEPSSVSRWRKDPSFEKLVAEKEQFVQALKATGLQPNQPTDIPSHKLVGRILDNLKKVRTAMPKHQSQKKE
jgi:hypothetical protein